MKSIKGTNETELNPGEELEEEALDRNPDTQVLFLPLLLSVTLDVISLAGP